MYAYKVDFHLNHSTDVHGLLPHIYKIDYYICMTALTLFLKKLFLNFVFCEMTLHRKLVWGILAVFTQEMML